MDTRCQDHQQGQPDREPGKGMKPTRDPSIRFQKHHLAPTARRGQLRMECGQIGLRVEIERIHPAKKIQHAQSLDACKTKTAPPIVE